MLFTSHKNHGKKIEKDYRLHDITRRDDQIVEEAKREKNHEILDEGIKA